MRDFNTKQTNAMLYARYACAKAHQEINMTFEESTDRVDKAMRSNFAETERLRAMNANLLAAARYVLLAVDDEGSASGDVRSSIERLRAAIAKAEELSR